MASSEPGKICTVCGEDCANKPRTKDTNGKYYCKPCYEHAKEQRTRLKRTRVAEPRVDEPPSLLAALIDSGPPTAVVAGCPGCGLMLAPGAAVCTNCGFNALSGKRLNVKVHKPKRDWAGPSTALAATLLSPTVIGMFAVAFFAVLFFIARESETAKFAYLGIQFLFGVTIAVWAIIAGFRESLLYGIGCLFCFPVALYVVFGLNENAYLKWLYLAAIVSSIFGYCLPGVFDHFHHGFGQY